RPAPVAGPETLGEALSTIANDGRMYIIAGMLRGREAARWLVRVLVSAGIIGYVLADVDLGDLARAMAHVRLAPALGALGLLLFPEYRFPRSLILGTVAVGGLLVAGWWAAPRLVRLLPAGRWTRELRREVEVDLAPLWRDRRLLATAAIVSVVFHLTQVAGQYVLARAAGARLPFSYCLIFHPVISVMTALPVSVNGVGVREGGYLYFLTRID